MTFFTPSPLLLPVKKLKKLAAMLTSPFANERANAVRAISRVLQSHGHGWTQVWMRTAAALDYATERGWYVFPAHPKEKKSLKSKKYSGGRAWGMTRDPVEILLNWLRWPRANVGVVTGPKSGFWVVEIDIKPEEGIDGAAALRWLEQQHGKLPDTLMSESPSGSVHRYFNWPGDGLDIKNSVSKIGRGIDVRGNGGMVIAVPSLRKGKPYRWLNPGTPIADAPAWLIAAARAATVGPRSSHTDFSGPEIDSEGHIQDGREGRMRAMIWRDVLTWRRETTEKPSTAAQEARAWALYLKYESQVVTRCAIPGLSKREGLEREGRGPYEFWAKWHYLMAKWDTPKFAAEAAKQWQRDEPEQPFDDEPEQPFDDRVDEPAASTIEEEINWALDIWADGQEELNGTPAERYLRGGAPIAALRFHPEFPLQGGIKIPALLALVSGAYTGEPQGIYVVALDSTAECWILGDSYYGAIQLVPPPFNYVGRELTIGGDLETTINMLRLGQTPIWCVPDLGAFPVLHEVEELTIIGGSALTAARWQAAERRVRVL